MAPRVSVLLSVYNGECFLAESIDSVLAQDFEDFELIIINDGSVDSTAEILENYNDARLSVINNETNIGVARSVNRGLTQAKGDYIARMDADDICFPHRLESQVDFLDKHPEIFLCGAWMIPMHQPDVVWKSPTHHLDIVCRLLFENCINQPTVMMRSERISNVLCRYSNDIRGTEDYDLWERLIWDQKVQVAVIPQPLIFYRVHPNSAGQSACDLQQDVADTVRSRQIERLGLQPTEQELLLHRAIARGCKSLESWSVFNRMRWLIKLVMANISSRQYAQLPFFKEIIKHLKIALFSQSVIVQKVFVNK